VQAQSAGERTRSGCSRPAAASDRGGGPRQRVVTGPGDPATKRIGLRYAIQENQHTTGGVSSQTAQTRALARGMSAARIGATKLSDPCTIERHFHASARLTL